MKVLETPVLVVGGGPVGLAQAIELGWRGIPCLLIEQGDGVVDHPRLGIILTRTMEFCRRWGIADRIYDCGFNNDYRLDIVYCTSLNGHILARDENPSPAEMTPPPQSPEHRQRCPQMWFNPILEDAARGHAGVEIRHFHRLDGFRETAEAVEATVTDTRSGERMLVRARYMVACDGAGSLVRRAVGVEMLGNPVLSYSVNIFVRAPRLLALHDMGEAERYIFVGPAGTWANMTVVDGRELWRFTVIGSERMMDLSRFDPMEHIARCAGRDDIPCEILSVTPWRRTELTAARMRFGRVFLAGDAAHTMSPTGGFGMSTGVADAVDLGWKLEAVLRGWAGPHLLDSYDAERRPAAQRAVGASARNFRAWVSAADCADILDDTPSGAATRARVGAHMKAHGRADWDSLGMQLGYVYEGSPVCVRDGTPPLPDTPVEYAQNARPGARAPHAWLPDGRSTLDLYGRGFVLLRLGAEPPSAEPLLAAAAAQGVPMRAQKIADPEVAALHGRRLVLVRPDGHVAWRGDRLPADPALLVAAVRGALAAPQKAALDAA